MNHGVLPALGHVKPTQLAGGGGSRARRLTPVGVQWSAGSVAQLSPRLAPPRLQSRPKPHHNEPAWRDGYRQLPAPWLHTSLPAPGSSPSLSITRERLRLCSHRLAGTAGPTPKFPRRAPAANAGREGWHNCSFTPFPRDTTEHLLGGDDECSLN